MAKRQMVGTPYVPNRTEYLDGVATTWSEKDIGKPVKVAGDIVRLCAVDDEIYGFIASVETGSKDGNRIAGVVCDSGTEALVTDEAGTLNVGDYVVCGTPSAVGTDTPAKGANVKVAAATPSLLKWMVMAVYAVGAGSQVLVRRV